MFQITLIETASHNVVNVQYIKSLVLTTIITLAYLGTNNDFLKSRAQTSFYISTGGYVQYDHLEVTFFICLLRQLVFTLKDFLFLFQFFTTIHLRKYCGNLLKTTRNFLIVILVQAHNLVLACNSCHINHKFHIKIGDFWPFLS